RVLFRSIGEDSEYAKRSRFLSGLGVNLTAFLQQSASIMIVIAGMYLVQDGTITAGSLIACVILGGRAISPLAQIANLMTRYHQAGSALKTLNKVMSSETERPINKDFLHRPKLKGHIKFDNVSFTYPHVEVPVLKGVSFTIEAGEKVGIIGRVGSGKSTISKLMIKLYEPESGVVLVDETDYRQIDPADLRKNFSYIGQEAVLFRGSVKDNIIVTAPQATEEEILACAKAAGVHDFIAHHPMGYDAPVGEQGNALSGGQRQAIAFARAMITRPHVLICDEPTSAMDTQTEQQFFKYVEEKLEGKTLILITHKHNLLSLVDRLILMHEGEIVMDGPREKVIKALNSGKIKVPGKGS
ncbi:MAG: ATP-binding cassette domain-containing protein, partial [Alphaproteobacteria bacterium]|nr:ATP-binding cassette domain-containing protein [Alphaproteobacteria bacterium]